MTSRLWQRSRVQGNCDGMFSDIILQVTVATRLRCGGIFLYFIATFLAEHASERILKTAVIIWDKYRWDKYRHWWLVLLKFILLRC